MTRRHIPKPIKELIVDLTNRGVSAPRIAAIVRCHERTVHRVRSVKRRTGKVENKPFVDGCPRILDGLRAAFVEGCIERQPDLTLAELRVLLKESCNVDVSTCTIYRTLLRRGFTRKKVTRPAKERDENDRAAYQLLIGHWYRADQLVFADESHVNRHVTRRAYAWAPTGDRARRRDFFVRGTRYSLLPAMSLDGILALDISTTSYTSATFYNFVSRLVERMQPYPNPNSVLILDNASIHRAQELRAMVEGRGRRLVLLPAYSPDLNPIEEAFSSIKHLLRRNRDYVIGELSGRPTANPYHMLRRAVYESVTPEKAYGWFRHSSYVV